MKLILVILVLSFISLFSFSQEKVNIRQVRKQAQKGNIESNYLLGKYYNEGKFVKKDSAKAFEYFEYAAEHEHIDAINWMINYYKKQKDEKPKLYFLWTEKAANLGDSVALYNKSKMHEIGFGCEKNLYSHFHYCKKAAEKGYIPAQKDLVNFYMTGYLTDTSIVKALQWQDSLVNQGDTESQVERAKQYYSGIYFEQDFAKALYFYDLAAEKDNSIAQICLINHYSGEFGFAKSQKQYEYWMQRFIENPNIDSTQAIEKRIKDFTELAYKSNHPIAIMAYWSQIKDTHVDTFILDNILESLAQLAENNIIYAKYQIADYCFQNREANNYNQKLIMSYAKSATISGIPEAKELLSDMVKIKYAKKDYKNFPVYYIDAIKYGINWAADTLVLTYAANGFSDRTTMKYFNKYKDFCSPNTYYKISYGHYQNDYGISNEEAISYCKYAIDYGITEAELLLAIYYYEGLVIEKNCSTTYEILSKDKLKMYAETDYYLSQIYMYGCDIDKDIDKAYELLKKSANNGFAKAQYEYAELIKKGTFPDIPKKESFKYYEMAAIGGINEAQIYVGKSYYYGRIVNKDDDKAFYYLVKANIGYDADLHYILAKLICEMSWDNPEKDMYMAAHTCIFAITKGNLEAKQLYCKYNLINHLGALEMNGANYCD